MSGIETQVVQGLTGLLSLAVTAAIAYAAPRAKRWVTTHTTAKAAGVATTVIDGLSSIAQAVVADFDQRIVNDAKAVGTWTPALAASVKADAVKAIMDQGAHLVALGQSVVGNVEALVSSLVEQAVVQSAKPQAAKPPNAAPAVASVAAQ